MAPRGCFGHGAAAGYKIGLTTPVMQRLCGVDEPCFSAIFAGEVHERRAELPAADYRRGGRGRSRTYRGRLRAPQRV